VKTTDQKEYLYGVVRDTGIGMDETQQAELFKQFSQADKSIARRYGGTGLGLAICQRLCQLMGGEIGVSSKQGSGTTFWFTVALQDLAQAQLSGAENISQEQRLHFYTQQFRGRRVLVAEDNKVNQMVVQGMLKKAGLVVDVVENGLQAVERICQQEERYDWVLMDWEMPEMDGLTACKQIRAWENKNGRPRTPIVALTAHVLSDYEQQAYAAGMQGFLKKPIDQNALFQSLFLTLSKTTE
jgi:CheY-like chemotaxis protein